MHRSLPRIALLVALAWLALLMPAALSQTAGDRFAVGEEAFRKGDSAAALEAFRGFLRQEPDGPRSSEATWKVAFSLEKLHREDEARAVLEDWLAEGRPDPWRVRGWTLLGELRGRSGRTPEAEAAFSRALAMAGRLQGTSTLRLEALLQRGRLRSRAREFQDRRPLAEADLVEVIRKDFRGPQGAAARLALGDLYLANPQAYDLPLERAVDVWRELVRVQPSSPLAPEARARAARAFTDEHRYLDALEDLEALVRDHPASPQARDAVTGIQEIRAPRLELSTGGVQRPGQPPRVLLRTRNLGAVELTAWPVDLMEAFARTRDLAAIPREFQPSGEPAARWEQPGEDLKDHSWREESLEVPVSGSGAFVVQATSGEHRGTALLLVSRLAVIQAAGPGGEAAAWLVDGQDGRSAREAEALLATGRTDPAGPFGRVDRLPVGAGGLLSLPAPSQAGGALLLARRGQDYALLADGRPPGRGEDWRIFFFTDRPGYRAGDRVRWKAAVRSCRPEGYEIPAGRPFQLEVRDPRGQVVQASNLVASPLGTLRGELPVPEDPIPGIWTVSLSTIEEKGPARSVGTSGFRIDTAAAPALQVGLGADQPWYLLGEKALATVEVRDSQERPIPGARIEWSVEAEPFAPTFLPDPSLPWFGAAPPATLEPASRVAGGRARSDAAGRARLAFPVEVLPSGASRPEGESFLIRARATDPAGRVGEGTLRVRAGGAALFLKIAAEGEVQPGSPVPLRLQATDVEGRPAAADVEVAVAGSTGRTILGRVRLDADGQGTLEWTPQGAGPYRLEASAAGPRGPAARAFRTVEASAPAVATLRVGTDRTRYRPGERARLRIRTPRGGCDVLLTLEGREVVRRVVVSCPSTDTRLDLPVGEDLAPGFRLRAATLRDFALEADEQEVLVPALGRVLAVQVEPISPPVPGRAGRLRIHTKDGEGRPVEAEVSLSLTGPETSETPRSPGLATWFFGSPSRSLVGLDTSLDFSFPTAGEPVATPRREPPAPASAPNLLPHRPRETAFWSSDLRTGPEGTAELALAWPSRPGTWVLIARALAAGGTMGEAVAEVDLRQRLRLGLSGPAFLTEGDDARFTAHLANLDSGPLAVHAVASASGVRLDGATEVDVAVPKAGQEDWTLSVATGSPGAAEVQVVVEGPGLRERATRAFQVLRNGLLREQVQAGGLEGMAAPRLPAPPEGATRRRLDVQLSPGLAGVLATATASLASAPRSSEGLVSRCAPASNLLRALRDLSLPRPAFAARFGTLVDESLRALQETQHADGGWGWYPEARSEPRMTAYVLQGLVGLRQAGHGVPAPMVERASTWLRGRLPRLAADDRAAALLALAAAGRAPERSAGELARRPRSMAPAARFQLALALHHLGHPEGARRLLREARAGVRFEGQGGSLASWPAGGGWTEAETTALALEAHLALEPEHPFVAAAARWLIARRGLRGWASTRETAVATTALARYLRRVGEEPSAFGYGIWLNGNEVETGRMGADTWSSSRVVTLTGAQLPEGPLEVEVRKAGQGEAWWCAVQSFSLRSATGTLDLQRRQFLVGPSGKRTPLKEGSVVRLGALVETVLELRVPRPLRHVVLEDRAPAGLEPLPPAPPTSGGHVDLGETGPVFSLPEVPAGRLRIAWIGRAAVVGDFRAAPAQVREQYNPREAGSSAPWRVSIRQEAR